MKASVKLDTKRKVQKSTDSTIVQVGMKSGNPKGFQEVGAESQNFREGMEVAKRNCNAPSK